MVAATVNLEMISLEDAEKLIGIKKDTIRSWVRSEKVAGRKKKPYQVNRASLMAYYLKDANGPLKELYSGRSDFGQRVSERSTADGVL